MHDWTRFWCLTSESFSLSDDGFLYDPLSEHGAIVNPTARVLADLQDTPCVVLLGEPGIGKSTAVEQQVAEMRALVAERADGLLSLDLGEYGDENRLIANLFGSADFRQWAEGHHNLYVFLDSLDECRLQIPHAAKIIASGLKRHRSQLGRMRLRISCRTADWPTFLTDRFSELWGSGAPAIHELLPLRRIDVVLAANNAGVDGNDFVNQVLRSGSQPFAIKPITLQFLLNVFKNNGTFPGTQSELYHKGCHLLCEEMNPARQSAGQVGRFGATERLAAAEQIAAVVVFCNRSAIHLAPTTTGAAADDITISELTLNSTNTGRKISDNLLRETLASGLFTARGHQRLGFAHRTLAEFLAASYLQHSEIPTKERLKLVQHAEDPNGRIVPQLRETAAWLASLDQAVFRAVTESDPQILLQSDAGSHGDEDRRALVDRVLFLAQTDELDRSNWSIRDYYHRLSHPGIAEQLAPLVVDRQEPVPVRRLAIELVQACCLQDVQNQLADIALDDTQEDEIRLSAANAIAVGGNESTQQRLRPLALSVETTSSALELKCAALKCLWPDDIGAADLFCALPVPTSDRFGSYGYFLRHELPESLRDENLPHALAWAASLDPRQSRTFSVRDLVAAIARRGWDCVSCPLVFDSFVEYALRQLGSHRDIVPLIDHEFVADEAMRRNLAETIVPKIDDFDRQGFDLIFQQPRLIRETDVSWMLGKLHEATDPAIAGRWAQLIGRLFNASVPGQLDEVLAAIDESDELRREFEPRFTAIELNSSDAQRLREQYHQIHKWQKEEDDARNSPPLTPSPRERIDEALRACEEGNIYGWYHASRALQLDINSTHYEHDLQVDLTTLPGWHSADNETRSRLLNGASRFLAESSAGDDWLGTNSTPYHAWWGYKALLLLRKEAIHLFDSLPDNIWAAWAPIIVEFSDHTVPQDNKDLHDEIARMCSERAPIAASDCLRRICERYDRADGTFILPQFLDRVWTDRAESTLCDVAENPEVKPAVVERVLDALLSHNSPRGRRIAIDLVSANQQGEPGVSEKQMAAAIALLRRAEDAGWTVVWPLVQRDIEFGKNVFLKVAYEDMHNPSVAMRIQEADVADLYIWLERQFPRESDPKHEGGYHVSFRDAVGEYRDGVLRVLEHRATSAAVQELTRIERELPHLDWMHRVVASAKVSMLRRTWRPIGPSNLLAATRHANSRLIRGARDLQDVILESLVSLQTSLQSETPAAPDLWDEISSGIFRPKDENHLSDYIKRHLERDLRGRGIVSLREVEIRRGEGSQTGERTDIHVTGHTEGIVPGELDQVRVIIEVKGTWHAHVDTAMESQLVNRYLKENECRHGIYVVGWYFCQQWDSNDRRKTSSKQESVQQLLDRLIAQAGNLSDDNIVIRPFVANASLR